MDRERRADGDEAVDIVWLCWLVIVPACGGIASLLRLILE
jgi:hypothetical protein